MSSPRRAALALGCGQRRAACRLWLTRTHSSASVNHIDSRGSTTTLSQQIPLFLWPHLGNTPASSTPSTPVFPERREHDADALMECVNNIKVTRRLEAQKRQEHICHILPLQR